MKLHLCTSQVTCMRVNKILGVDTQYTAKVKKSLKQICTTHDFTELKLNNLLLFTFYSSIQMNSPFSCYFLDLRISFPGLRSRMFYVLMKDIKSFFLNSEGNWRQYLKKKIGDIKTEFHLYILSDLVYL